MYWLYRLNRRFGAFQFLLDRKIPVTLNFVPGWRRRPSSGRRCSLGLRWRGRRWRRLHRATLLFEFFLYRHVPVAVAGIGEGWARGMGRGCFLSSLLDGNVESIRLQLSRWCWHGLGRRQGVNAHPGFLERFERTGLHLLGLYRPVRATLRALSAASPGVGIFLLTPAAFLGGWRWRRRSCLSASPAACCRCCRSLRSGSRPSGSLLSRSRLTPSCRLRLALCRRRHAPSTGRFRRCCRWRGCR